MYVGEMAAKRAKLVESDDVNCVICNAPFCEPKVLSCLHHYCKECIQGQTATNGNFVFRCLKCERETTLRSESDVNHLPTAFFIQRLENFRCEIAKAEKGEVMCSSHRSKNAASFCRSACEFLCEYCEQAHREMIHLKDHKVKPLEQLKPEDLLLECPPTIICEQHSEPQEYYCSKCEQLICRHCIILQHQDHKCDTIQNASAGCKRELQRDIESLDSYQISDAVKEAEEVKSAVTTQVTESEQKIDKAFSEVLSVVESRRNALLHDVHSEAERRHTDLDVQLASLTPTMSEVQRVVEFTKRCLHCACNAELLSLRTTLLTKIQEEIKECESLPLELPMLADIAVNVEDCAEKVAHALQQHAQLSIMQPNVVEVKEDGIHKAKMNKEAKFIFGIAHPGIPCKETHQVEAQLKSEVAPGSIVDARVVRLNPGTYEATYRPTVRGRHQLDVCVDGCQATGSPFEVCVECPPEQLGDPVDYITGLNAPYGAAFDHAGHLIVPLVSGRICVIIKNNDGYSLRQIEFDELYQDSAETSTQLHRKYGVACDKDGYIYITGDFARDGCIRKYDRTWKLLRSGGKQGSQSGEFMRPGRIAINRDKLYICDRDNKRIQVFDTDLVFRGVLSHSILGRPVDIAFDSADNAYVTDHVNHQVLKFNCAGELTDTIGEFGSDEGKLDLPRGILVHKDFVYVTERNNKRVSVFKVNGDFVTTFGSQDVFLDPGSIVVDTDGFLYVCDQNSGRIVVF